MKKKAAGRKKSELKVRVHSKSSRHRAPAGSRIQTNREKQPSSSELLTVSSPQTRPAETAVIDDLPFSYGETKLVLLVRDPYWAYSYWDFSPETWNWIQAKLSEDQTLKPLVRIHDLDSKHSWDLLISLEAKNWYLHLGIPDRRYAAELGLGDGNSRFYLIVRSNEVRTPRDSPSERIDPEWDPRDFEELYRLTVAGKAGPSSFGSSFLLRQG